MGTRPPEPDTLDTTIPDTAVDGQFGSQHPAGVGAVLLDGSVRVVSYDVERAHVSLLQHSQRSGSVQRQPVLIVRGIARCRRSPNPDTGGSSCCAARIRADRLRQSGGAGSRETSRTTGKRSAGRKSSWKQSASPAEQYFGLTTDDGSLYVGYRDKPGVPPGAVKIRVTHYLQRNGQPAARRRGRPGDSRVRTGARQDVRVRPGVGRTGRTCWS